MSKTPSKQIVISQYELNDNGFTDTKEKYLKALTDRDSFLDEGDKVYVYELKETLVYKIDLVPEKKAVNKKSKA